MVTQIHVEWADLNRAIPDAVDNKAVLVEKLMAILSKGQAFLSKETPEVISVRVKDDNGHFSSEHVGQ